jgi:hypothetical protein
VFALLAFQKTRLHPVGLVIFPRGRHKVLGGTRAPLIIIHIRETNLLDKKNKRNKKGYDFKPYPFSAIGLHLYKTYRVQIVIYAIILLIR